VRVSHGRLGSTVRVWSPGVFDIEWNGFRAPMMLDARVARSVGPLFNRRIHHGKDE
jgi:hypothetical protein